MYRYSFFPLVSLLWGARGDSHSGDGPQHNVFG